MLLIGSRATLVYFPDFRTPKDWDVVATKTEVAELSRRLPRLSLAGSEKPLFVYDSALVEVTPVEGDAYWGSVYAEFSSERVLDEPTLGPLQVAPPAYQLITKHCGLIFHRVHWHKNLEDFHYLRDRVLSIPDNVADLIPGSLDNARSIFGESHDRYSEPRTCHPSVPANRHPALHERLHQLVASPECAALPRDPRLWVELPRLEGPEHVGLMERLLADEAMVLAAEDFLLRGSGNPSHAEHQFLITALRELCTGCLPVGWRYFCVNHFREILALVPEGFLARLGDLIDGQKAFPRGMQGGGGCDLADGAQLRPAATGASKLPRVIGGDACFERRAESERSCSPLPE